MEVLEFKSLPDNDHRMVLRSDSGAIYHLQVTSDIARCSCAGYHYRKTCKHLDVMVEHTLLHGEYIAMLNSKIATSINGLNNILGGGIPQGMLTWFYGKPESSKTTTATWAALDVMREKKDNFVVVDMETGFARFVAPVWVEVYNKVHGTDFGIKYLRLDYRKWIATRGGRVEYQTLYDDEKSKQLIVVDVASAEELLLLVGKPMQIKDTGTKITVTRHGKTENLFEYIWESPLAQLLANSVTGDTAAGFLIDSMSVVSKEFGTANQNYPARDSVQSMIINQLSYILAYNVNAVGIMVAHASYNPAQSNPQTNPVGGKSVGHGGKFIIEFIKDDVVDNKTLVRMKAYRLPATLNKKDEILLVSSDRIE